MKLRSVELQVPDTEAAFDFLASIWGLRDAGSTARGTRFLRAAGPVPCVVSLSPGAPSVSSITFMGTDAEISLARSRAVRAGAPVESLKSLDEPGGGEGFRVEGPEGQIFRLICRTEPVTPIPETRDRPLQITHVVINALDREVCARFLVEVLGFRLSDRTAGMSFLRCDEVHHAVAYAQSGISSLNHIAFEMEGIDDVMRGIGRLRDVGLNPAWGPGRHGPGNNVFAYFISPFGATLEYTAEVQRVGDDYRVGEPEDWKWPPNRVDHWGVSGRNSAALAEAEKTFRFRGSGV